MKVQIQWFNVANQQRTLFAQGEVDSDKALQLWIRETLTGIKPPCDMCIPAVYTEDHENFIREEV